MMDGYHFFEEEEDLSGSGGETVRPGPWRRKSSLGRACWTEEETESLLRAMEACHKACPSRGIAWDDILSHMHSDGHTGKNLYHIQKKYQNICWGFRKLKSWRLRKCLPLFEDLPPTDRSNRLLPRRFCPRLYARMEAFYSSTGIDDGVRRAMEERPLLQHCRKRNQPHPLVCEHSQQDRDACKVQDACVSHHRGPYELRSRGTRAAAVSSIDQFLAAGYKKAEEGKAGIHAVDDGNVDNVNKPNKYSNGDGDEDLEEEDICRGCFHDGRSQPCSHSNIISGSHDDECKKVDGESERRRSSEHEEKIGGGGGGGGGGQGDVSQGILQKSYESESNNITGRKEEENAMDKAILQHIISMDKHLSDFIEAVKMNMRMLNVVVEKRSR